MRKGNWFGFSDVLAISNQIRLYLIFVLVCTYLNEGHSHVAREAKDGHQVSILL